MLFEVRVVSSAELHIVAFPDRTSGVGGVEVHACIHYLTEQVLAAVHIRGGISTYTGWPGGGAPIVSVMPVNSLLVVLQSQQCSLATFLSSFQDVVCVQRSDVRVREKPCQYLEVLGCCWPGNASARVLGKVAQLYA